MSCQAYIHKSVNESKVCGKPTTTKYCAKHKRQKIVDKAKEENIRYCDISRGCFTELEDYQVKCTTCLRRAQIRDRKRADKKRQDPNLCLDCGNTLTEETRAIGKHDKKLRRCTKCYEKLLKVESQRDKRERNYKQEAFKNKHIVWNQYITGAKKRGIDFSIQKDDFNLLITQKCFYCDYQKEGEINGIDRIDNNKGYIKDNVVACCQVCNILKGSQHPQEFIDKLGLIYNYTYLSQEQCTLISEKWSLTYLSKTIPTFSRYKKGANTRNIEFKLDEEQFISIVNNSCYICGIASSDTNKNGIDRVDNNKGYLIDNCKACCGHCNLLKKDLPYDTILDKAKLITNKYDILSEYFKQFDIKQRESKIEVRNKVINPLERDIEGRQYKPLNEVIMPVEAPEEIKNILDSKEEKYQIKQWKMKQIYEAIQEDRENEYKLFCEKNNTLSSIKDWDTRWFTFILAVKGTALKDCDLIIRKFLEDLRRLRHNKLCTSKTNVVEREDRQQWPATSIVKAFLESKLDNFKKFTEEQSNENPEDSVWQKRWNKFQQSLEDNKDNTEELKSLCSKFMTAQRTKRYRQKTNPTS